MCVEKYLAGAHIEDSQSGSETCTELNELDKDAFISHVDVVGVSYLVFRITGTVRAIRAAVRRSHN